MMDITALAARTVKCPFAIVAVDSAVAYHEASAAILFVGCDRACLLSIKGDSLHVNRFIPQFHRKLTAGTCCGGATYRGDVLALGDCNSAITLHRASFEGGGSVTGAHVNSTVFVGDSWDGTPCIKQIVPVWEGNGSGVGAVSMRCGEAGVVWAVPFERAEALRVAVPTSVDCLFLQQHRLPSTSSFLCSSSRGFSLFSLSNSGVLVHFPLPEGMHSVSAAQIGADEGPWYAAVTTCGTALIYDQRRVDQPVWSRHFPSLSSVIKCASDRAPQHVHIASSGDGVWAALGTGGFVFLRNIEGSVGYKTFAAPEDLVSPYHQTAGIFFEGGILHLVRDAEGAESPQEESAG
ncbi:hypothetical protein ERJ75_001537800 [Trypanosoma vivax]|uniref:Uncharacterized protein n=1 Tax=Trypanosoma vivax (strain Y486) TaxID=1055687 RepID=G0U7Y1_TRYVY|nr:hypothetical protein TRVL_01793 [Trypanosoma vivax]KAH8606326.1 hypothetical protein ERJ75_001537800 [Trypanosoma vivax]CCC51989.1 conserved hypothetical protein [Trypanosoma vivax Y486]